MDVAVSRWFVSGEVVDGGVRNRSSSFEESGPGAMGGVVAWAGSDSVSSDL